MQLVRYYVKNILSREHMYSVSHIRRLCRLFQCRDITTELQTHLITIRVPVEWRRENCVKHKITLLIHGPGILSSSRMLHFQCDEEIM